VDRAKLLACKWFMAKCPASSCTYHEWEVQPVFCLHREGFVVVVFPGCASGVGRGLSVSSLPGRLPGLFLCFLFLAAGAWRWFCCPAFRWCCPVGFLLFCLLLFFLGVFGVSLGWCLRACLLSLGPILWVVFGAPFGVPFGVPCTVPFFFIFIYIYISLPLKKKKYINNTTTDIYCLPTIIKQSIFLAYKTKQTSPFVDD